MQKIGILALQGGIEEHENILKKLGVKPISIKKLGQLTECQGLILPGGESTTISKLLIETSLQTEIVQLAKKGFPIWGTCAGMILLAKKIINQNNSYLSLMDITICRNAYGRQQHSFQTTAIIPALSNEPFPLVFIRAPYVTHVGENVRILLKLNQKIVAVQEGNLIGTAFHPELTTDWRFHEFFLTLCKKFQRENNPQV